jgi:type VI secretion system VasD/TssJ family lipoprotein
LNPDFPASAEDFQSKVLLCFEFKIEIEVVKHLVMQRKDPEMPRKNYLEKIHIVLMSFFIIPVLAGCAPTIKEPAWIFEKESIKIHIKADHQLNLYNGKAHTLYIGLYQLVSINAFNQLSADKEGIRKLLECKPFDGSVTSVVSNVIHAGENITLTLDRTEKSQYLAIVTGYSESLNETGMVRWHRIPVHKKRESFFKNKYRCFPCPLSIELILGQRRIEHSDIMPSGKLKCHDECE